MAWDKKKKEDKPVADKPKTEVKPSDTAQKTSVQSGEGTKTGAGATAIAPAPSAEKPAEAQKAAPVAAKTAKKHPLHESVMGKHRKFSN